MRSILLGALTAGALFFTATASAVTIQTTDASQPWQQWADQAQVPTYAGALPFTATQGYFACGSFADAEGCTSFTPQVDQTTGQTIPGPPASISTQIAVVNDQWSDRGTLYHELGQVFWSEYMTPADEDRFMQIVGLAGDHTNWVDAYTDQLDGYTYTFPPYEWFAEAYRLCATWGVNQPADTVDYTVFGYKGLLPEFAAQQRAACGLIDQVGLDNGISTPAQTTYPTSATSVATALTVAKPVRSKRLNVATRRRKHVRRIVTSWGRKRVW